MSGRRFQPRCALIKENPVAVRQGPIMVGLDGERTSLKPGDQLVLLGDNTPENLGLWRDEGRAMGVEFQYGEKKENSPFLGKVFSEEEAYSLAMGLAIGAGLDFEVSVAQNGAFPECRIVTFRFVPFLADG